LPRAPALTALARRSPAALEADGVGASGAELRQELTWLLDDAVAFARAAAAAPWRPCSWAAAARGGAPPAALRLRAALPALQHLWRRRLAREPFQYLVAAAHWRDLLLAVGPGVLIPRPETETLVDLVQAAVAQAPTLAHGAWADAGTGSGAIAVALARMLAPDAPPVAATDVSDAALAYAAANAARAGVAARVAPMRGEWLAPVLAARGAGCLSGTILVLGVASRSGTRG
jgi:release factor glutamine methyltransferase